MSVTDYKRDYVNAGIFYTLTGDYVGFVDVLSGQPYAADTTVTLRLCSTFETDVLVSPYLKNREIIDAEELPFKEEDVLFQPNDYLNARTFSEKLENLKKNNTFIFSRMFMPSNDLPLSQNIIYFGVTGADDNNFTIFSDYSRTIPLSSNKNFNYISSVKDVELAVNKNDKESFAIFAITEKNFITFTGNKKNISVTENELASRYIESTENSITFNSLAHLCRSEKYLYITDYGDNLIYKYEVEGFFNGDLALQNKRNLIEIFGGKGTVQNKSKFNGPREIATNDKYLFVNDSNNFVVKIYDLDFNYTHTIKSIPQKREDLVAIQCSPFQDHVYFLTREKNNRLKLYIYDSNCFLPISSYNLGLTLAKEEVINSIEFNKNNSYYYHICTNLEIYKYFTSKPDTLVGRYGEESLFNSVFASRTETTIIPAETRQIGEELPVDCTTITTPSTVTETLTTINRVTTTTQVIGGVNILVAPDTSEITATVNFDCYVEGFFDKIEQIRGFNTNITAPYLYSSDDTFTIVPDYQDNGLNGIDERSDINNAVATCKIRAIVPTNSKINLKESGLASFTGTYTDRNARLIRVYLYDIRVNTGSTALGNKQILPNTRYRIRGWSNNKTHFSFIMINKSSVAGELPIVNRANSTNIFYPSTVRDFTGLKLKSAVVQKTWTVTPTKISERSLTIVPDDEYITTIAIGPNEPYRFPALPNGTYPVSGAAVPDGITVYNIYDYFDGTVRVEGAFSETIHGASTIVKYNSKEITIKFSYPQDRDSFRYFITNLIGKSPQAAKKHIIVDVLYEPMVDDYEDRIIATKQEAVVFAWINTPTLMRVSPLPTTIFRLSSIENGPTSGGPWTVIPSNQYTFTDGQSADCIGAGEFGPVNTTARDQYFSSKYIRIKYYTYLSNALKPYASVTSYRGSEANPATPYSSIPSFAGKSLRNAIDFRPFVAGGGAQGFDHLPLKPGSIMKLVASYDEPRTTLVGGTTQTTSTITSVQSTINVTTPGGETQICNRQPFIVDLPNVYNIISPEFDDANWDWEDTPFETITPPATEFIPLTTITIKPEQRFETVVTSMFNDKYKGLRFQNAGNAEDIAILFTGARIYLYNEPDSYKRILKRRNYENYSIYPTTIQDSYIHTSSINKEIYKLLRDLYTLKNNLVGKFNGYYDHTGTLTLDDYNYNIDFAKFTQLSLHDYYIHDNEKNILGVLNRGFRNIYNLQKQLLDLTIVDRSAIFPTINSTGTDYNNVFILRPKLATSNGTTTFTGLTSPPASATTFKISFTLTGLKFYQAFNKYEVQIVMNHSNNVPKVINGAAQYYFDIITSTGVQLFRGKQTVYTTSQGWSRNSQITSSFTINLTEIPQNFKGYIRVTDANSGIYADSRIFDVMLDAEPYGSGVLGDFTYG